MAIHLVDLASYQAGINLRQVKSAGYELVNIKLTQGNWYTWSGGRAMADTARTLGMSISTFSWIDNSASGAVQAAYAYRQMQAIGGPDGMAHQCDNEDNARPATWAITRDYVSWWQDKLGRPIYMYTGDWWATSGGRAGWNVAALTPYLMAAPNAGYLGSYPGDQSPHWRAGYWGYDYLSLMQYAVSPLPGAGGGDLSKTAIRDPAVWAALTGGATVAGEADAAFSKPYTGTEPWISGQSWASKALEGPLRDVNRKADAVIKDVAEMKNRPAATVALDADAEARIIDGVVAKLGSVVADELAKRLSNG